MPRLGEAPVRHLSLIGGPEDAASLVTDAGIAERVSRSLPGPGEADAVVVLGDGSASLKDAAASLRAEGWLYWEIRRPAAVLPGLAARRAVRELRTAGLTPTGIYWIEPHSAPPAMFVPLDVRGAVAWYLDTFSSPRLGMLAALWPEGSRVLAMLRAARVAITAVAHPNRNRPPALLAAPELPASLRAARLKPVVRFREHSRRVVIFPFRENASGPEAVVKFSPVPSRGIRTSEEQRILSEIRERSTPKIRASIPEPLGVFDWSGLTVGAETYLAGRSIERSVGLPTSFAAKADDLQRVVAWLCEFQAANSFGAPPWGGDAWPLARWVEEPLRLLEQEADAPESVQRLFVGIRGAAARLRGTPLPLVLSNWSFSAGNVSRSEGRISVYDWELVERGLPMTDLVYFLLDWGRLVLRQSRPDWRTSFRDLLIAPPTDRVGRAAQRSLDRYVSALGIDRRFRPLLAALTWVQRAAKRAKKDGAARRPIDPRLVALAEAAGDWLEG